MAFIPDWYFDTQWMPDGPALVRELIAPACTAVTHVAVKDREAQLARLRAAFPSLILPPARGGRLAPDDCLDPR